MYHLNKKLPGSLGPKPARGKICGPKKVQSALAREPLVYQYAGEPFEKLFIHIAMYIYSMYVCMYVCMYECMYVNDVRAQMKWYRRQPRTHTSLQWRSLELGSEKLRLGCKRRCTLRRMLTAAEVFRLLIERDRKCRLEHLSLRQWCAARLTNNGSIT